jgi:glycosyltransferase involved in cell wall biosynthesis
MHRFMSSILFLVPDLDYHGRSRQAVLLAGALPRQRFTVRCFAYKTHGPFAEPLRRAGVELLGQPGRRLISLENLRWLRQLLTAERPALVHVWGLDALRFIWWSSLLRRSLLPPLVVSLTAGCFNDNGLLWWQRWLLERTAAVAVNSEAERSALIGAGLRAENVHVIRPGVSLPASSAGLDFRAGLGIPKTDKVFMMVGHMNAPDRFHDGLWAFDSLRGVDPSLHLIVVGDGPFRHCLVDFSEFAARPGLGVHFAGARPDAADLLSAADIVVVGHQRTGGTYAVLEGLAAGRPVVAVRLPHLADSIRDGETGFFVPPGDPPALVRTMKRLLDDPPLRQRVGAAAQRDVQSNFGTTNMASRFADLYDVILTQ